MFFHDQGLWKDVWEHLSALSVLSKLGNIPSDHCLGLAGFNFSYLDFSKKLATVSFQLINMTQQELCNSLENGNMQI